jgi:hypothetical protein
LIAVLLKLFFRRRIRGRRLLRESISASVFVLKMALLFSSPKISIAPPNRREG